MKLHRILASKTNMVYFLLLVLGLFIILEVTWTNIEYIQRRSYKHTCEDCFLSTHSYSCLDRLATDYDRVEDIFCTNLPKFIPDLKNPCFYDFKENSSKALSCLPYFYIIGMDKCGSTDLHSRIVMHSFVTENGGFLRKETNYWSWLRYGIHNKRILERKTTFNEYTELFNETSNMIDSTSLTELITGDATPMDLWDFRSWPLIPQNKDKKEPVVLTPHFLKYIYGERIPKFIIQLREPVERLYSDYIFLEYGKNPAEFHNHSLQAISMINSCLKNNTKRICYFSSELYNILPVRIHLGCYSVFLREWFNVFPRSSFLVTRMDEYQSDMASTLHQVFKFLDLPSLPDFRMKEIINQTRHRVTQSKEGTVLPETVAALRKFYDECNKETAELLGDERFLWKDHYN